MRARVGPIAKLRATAGFIGVVRNWGEHYWATHGPSRPKRLVYVLRNGLRLEARPRTLDVAVLKDVFFHRIYEQHGLQIRAGATILDVGAHIGAFAASAARAAPGVSVFAFEPAPENFELLSGNVARNGLSGVRLAQCAVSGKGGPRQLHLSGSPAGHSLHLAEPGGKDIPVETLSLADILGKHGLDSVDLLKMDCEGAEYEILEGSPPDAIARVRAIAMEAHTLDGSRGPAEAAALLTRRGFEVRLEEKGDSTSMIWAKRTAP